MSDVIFESNIDKVYPGIVKKLVNLFNNQSRWLQKYIREEHMTGPTGETSVRARTTLLRASVMPIKTEITDMGEVQAGVSIGPVIYARVHIGPKGQVTTIIPKKSKFLTIPIDKAHGGVVDENYKGPFGAMTPGGVSRGRALTGPWGETFVKKSEKGNLIIWGKLRIGGKGKNAGKLQNKIVPLFLLKKMVKVKARIHPEDIVDAFKLKVAGELQAIGVNILGE